MKKTKIQREIEKKQQRRLEELKQLQGFDIRYHCPAAPKKPVEFNFDKGDVQSFAYPVAIGNTLVEKKSDGYCVHIGIDHKAVQPIKIFSSGSNEWDPNCFPELLDDLSNLPSGYYHGELLGRPNKERFTSLDEFTAIESRPKLSTRDITPELIAQYPLKLDIFDVLLMEGTPLLTAPLSERRYTLEHTVQTTDNLDLSQQCSVGDAEGLQEHFLWAINKNYEGLIAKDPNSLYVPGSRDTDWVKLKEFTTLDLAVLGFYETPESQKAGKPFSAMLVGSYNPETGLYETMAKVKVGKKQDQEAICRKAKYTININGDYEKISNCDVDIAINPEMRRIKRKIPERIVSPPQDNVAIVEVQVLDVTYKENWHSCGLGYDGRHAHSLRIPTFKQLRTDKTRVQDVTTTQQVHKFYTG